VPTLRLGPGHQIDQVIEIALFLGARRRVFTRQHAHEPHVVGAPTHHLERLHQARQAIALDAHLLFDLGCRACGALVDRRGLAGSPLALRGGSRLGGSCPFGGRFTVRDGRFARLGRRARRRVLRDRLAGGDFCRGFLRRVLLRFLRRFLRAFLCRFLRGRVGGARVRLRDRIARRRLGRFGRRRLRRLAGRRFGDRFAGLAGLRRWGRLCYFFYLGRRRRRTMGLTNLGRLAQDDTGELGDGFHGESARAVRGALTSLWRRLRAS
jgi:hypothetical protein